MSRQQTQDAKLRKLTVPVAKKRKIRFKKKKNTIQKRNLYLSHIVKTR